MSFDAIEKYRSYLQYQSISIHTRRNYLQRVRNFLQWLDGSPDGLPALTDPVALKLLLRDYKAFLLARGASASTINGVLSAVDNFSISRGRCRLSIASIDRIVRQIGRSANIELSAGRLRFDFMNRLIQSKLDIVMIAELCGHAKLESVRRYYRTGTQKRSLEE